MRIDPGTAFLQGTGRSSPRPRPENGGGDFAGMLRNALQEVNKLQLEADELSRRLAEGTLENLHEVTIAAEKAALALELTVQVRNKVIEAYQEIMRMPV